MGGNADVVHWLGPTPMSASVADNLGTAPVRAGYAFDERALAAWLAHEVDGFAGPLRVEQFRGGQSNPTYKLMASGRSYVLRRKPPGGCCQSYANRSPPASLRS